MTLPIGQILGLRNFRLLFISTAISLLGSQFTLIAIPWLVLQLTGDPFDLGIVLALEGIPRAIFMILGGAICDRMHPSRMMLITDILSCLLMTAMAIVLYCGAMHMGWLYAFALLFGLVSGIAIPATNSIIPHLIQDRHLEAGNSFIMGATQLTAFVGPTLAGVLLGQLATSSHPFELVFVLDALSFAISTLLLWMIQCNRDSSQQKEKGRLMSLLTFSNAGFLALSQLAAGYLAAWNLSGLFFCRAHQFYCLLSSPQQKLSYQHST